MHKKLFLFLILLTAVSCSSRRVSVITPASERLSSFSVLEVAEVDTNVQGIEFEVLTKMRSDIIKEVSDLRRFRSVTGQTEETDGVLQFESSILSYEKGSRPSGI